MHQNPSYPHLIRISLKQQDPYPQVTTPMFKGTKNEDCKTTETMPNYPNVTINTSLRLAQHQSNNFPYSHISLSTKIKNKAEKNNSDRARTKQVS